MMLFFAIKRYHLRYHTLFMFSFIVNISFHISSFFRAQPNTQYRLYALWTVCVKQERPSCHCSAHNITQSMSRAGCPYDNAPMERYFNTLKSELIYQQSYSSEEKLFADIDDYVLLWYNSVRPHSFNNGLTPWQKQMA